MGAETRHGRERKHEGEDRHTTHWPTQPMLWAGIGHRVALTLAGWVVPMALTMLLTLGHGVNGTNGLRGVPGAEAREAEAASDGSGLASGGVEAEEAYRFGLWLQDRGEYYRAITEFQRTVFLCGDRDTPLRRLARFHHGRSAALGGDHEDAERTLREVILAWPDEPIAFRSRVILGRTLLSIHDRDHAEAVLREGLTYGETVAAAGPFMVRLHEELGWCALQRAAWSEAATAFGQAATLSPGDTRLAALAQVAPQGARLRKKSPALAGVLSGVLPGLGQVTNGQVGDGIAAFLVNGLFIWGAVAAAEKDMPEVAAVLGFMEIGWYGGNIVGAVSGAHRFNRREQQAFLDRVTLDYRLPLRDD